MVVAAVVATDVLAAAQSVSAPGLKAAYLFNFAQFVEWPSDVLPSGARLALCIVNDDAVADALEGTIKGRAVGGHPLAVVRLKAGAPLPACHILYLADTNQKLLWNIIRGLNGKLVLTVSDTPRFARTGGMVELFVEGGRMRIAVNIEALQRGNVRLSSRVLQLATIVRDAPSE